MLLSARCAPCNDRMEISFKRFIGIIHGIFVGTGDEGKIISIIIVTIIYLVRIFINFGYVCPIRIPIVWGDLSCLSMELSSVLNITYELRVNNKILYIDVHIERMPKF